MSRRARGNRIGLLACAASGLLLQHPALSQTSASNALTRTYLPAVEASLSTFNPDPLAVVDTLSYRKHVAGNDGIPVQSVPTQYFRYSFPSASGTLQVTCPSQTTMLVGTTNNAGYTWVDSTGTRYLQIALLTNGTPDTPGQPDVSPTAQTWYRTSNDGGHTFSNFKQVIAGGAGFTACHPVPGVTIGKNGYQFPGNSLIVGSNQEQDVLIPLVIIPPLDANGNPVQPQHSVTSYADVQILRGHWRSDGSDIDWEAGQPAQVTETQSTRGVDETAIVEMATNGHCAIVSRGSNQAVPSIPSHYWLFESLDGCRTWVGPGTALSWDDGSIYYAPAAPPFLSKNRNDRILFLGANTDANPSGNCPRTRVVAAELDLKQLKLRKRSAVIVDEKDAYDSNNVDLIYSNRYYPQSSGAIFYYTRRLDPGTGSSSCSAATESGFPTNWHLLNPFPLPAKHFAISQDSGVPNQVDWPAQPTVQKFLVYARNPSEQGFWQLNGEVDAGSATSYVLHSLPAGAVEVSVFAQGTDGSLSSSNQITVAITGH